jgi:hypothetical protein
MPNDPTSKTPAPTPPAAPLLATMLAAVVVVVDVVAVAVEFAPADGDEEVEGGLSALAPTFTPTLPRSCCVKASTSKEPQTI